MKNSVKKGVVHYLILNKGKEGYLGICKEFGFVEEADTKEKVLEKLINGSVLLLEAVRKNPRLELSLNIRPPFKYLALFYLVPIWGSLNLFFSRFNGDITLISKDLSGVAHA